MHEPPDSPPNVPYQAYRSKRHSRNVSNPRIVSNVSPPSLSRPASIVDVPPEPKYSLLSEKSQQQPTYSVSVKSPPQSPTLPLAPALIVVDSVSAPDMPLSEVPIAANGFGPNTPDSKGEPVSELHSTEGTVASVVNALQKDVDDSSLSNSNTNGSADVEQLSVPEAFPLRPENVASSSASPSVPTTPSSASRKISTIRRVPRASRSALPTSPLAPNTHSRTVSMSSLTSTTATSRHSIPPASAVEAPLNQTLKRSSLAFNPDLNSHTANRLSTSSVLPTATSLPYEPRLQHRPTDQPPPSPTRTNSSDLTPRHIDSLPAPQPHHAQAAPLPRTSPLSAPSSSSTSPAISPAPIAQSLSSSSTSRPTSAQSHPIHRTPAPYRPGFQPKGLYRPRTDEFLSARRLARDGSTETGSQKRVERTKLERRLEKIIALHFPEPGQTKERSSVGVGMRPNAGGSGGGVRRRTTSFFDLDLGELKRMSISDAGGLWKGVLASTGGSNKSDLRASEQRITPWQEDASVSRCPLCAASFHPLTNRKHHCRLCGQIICSLPPKQPQRPQPCSMLFVVDPKTRQIEEVEEGVDYGVKKTRGVSIGGAGDLGPTGKDEEEEKFLKGVRICRECRPVLLRQQYFRETAVVPNFARLYDVFIALEKEIEDSLPQFEELLLSLNQNEQLTKEAAAARKRILEVFAQYDSLSKRIRKLPCKTGSSQDRVQMAVMTRANVFLQKHMFPLQSLPKPEPKESKNQNKESPSSQLVDPDSEVAMALQPLLEQEALLESFVEEATAHRKFEDAKTLRANLKEIRAEIERILGNAEAGTGASLGKAGHKPAKGSR